MDLVVYQMVELQHIHVADGYRIVEVLSCTSVSESELTVSGISCLIQEFQDVLLNCAVEYRCGDIPALLLAGQSEVDLKCLSYVHTGRYAQRVKHYLERLTILKERHILFRKYSGDNTLVTVTSGHLIADVDLSLGGDVYADKFIYSGRKLVAVLAGKYLNVHNDTCLAVRNLKGCISNFSCLLTKDGAEKSFF